MTKSQAAQLQAQWEARGGKPLCEHPNQKMEDSEGGYLTGNFHCTDCGEYLVKRI
ncbi:MAG TPA: hypothetical protein VIW47_12450 [Nitrospiraceae bacterium]